MVRVKASRVILGLLLTLVACSQPPVATLSLETSTPAAPAVVSPALTPWVAGTETALAALTAPTPGPNQGPIEKPAGFSPVLYGGKVYQTTFFLLLGGVGRETWLAPEISVSRFAGEVTYSLHSFTQEAKYFLWGKAPQFSPTCQAYTIGTDAVLDEAGFIGVVDGWSVTKRPVTELADNGEFYRQAVLDWLNAEGVADPELDSIHVFRVDLEGDGSDEVFISASHLDDSQHTTRAGDYSILLMRQAVGTEAVTRLVVGDVYRSKEPEITYPRSYSLANFIDLNQDGILEVVVDVHKWEGFGARVFQIDEGDVIPALNAEC